MLLMYFLCAGPWNGRVFPRTSFQAHCPIGPDGPQISTLHPMAFRNIKRCIYSRTLQNSTLKTRQFFSHLYGITIQVFNYQHKLLSELLGVFTFSIVRCFLGVERWRFGNSYLFPSSGDGEEKTPTHLGPLEGAMDNSCPVILWARHHCLHPIKPRNYVLKNDSASYN
jgi:hypothetical protein